MKIIESSFCIRDSTDVIHKENVKGDVFLFSRLKATLPSYVKKTGGRIPQRRGRVWGGKHQELTKKLVIRNSASDPARYT
jgi:hypothetical protein